MQPCQVCGATRVDAGGYCEHCQTHRGAESYSVSPPAGGSPVSGSPADAGAYYYSAASAVGRATVAVYPAATGEPAEYPPPVETRPARGPQPLTLFMLTVMVVVLVAGTVAIVLIREKGLAAGPPAKAAQGTPSTAPATPASAAPSASASGSSTVDKCLVGEWTVTSWRLPYSAEPKGEMSTTNGGIVRFRADGTGEWDFGSGVKLVGTGPTRNIAIRLTGRFTFAFRTVGQTFEFGDVQADARQEVTESEEVLGAGSWVPQLAAYAYACAGDVFRWMPDDHYETRLQRRA
jgi:hypothetical protein